MEGWRGGSGENGQGAALGEWHSSSDLAEAEERPCAGLSDIRSGQRERRG